MNTNEHESETMDSKGEMKMRHSSRSSPRCPRSSVPLQAALPRRRLRRRLGGRDLPSVVLRRSRDISDQPCGSMMEELANCVA